MRIKHFLLVMGIFCGATHVGASIEGQALMEQGQALQARIAQELHRISSAEIRTLTASLQHDVIELKAALESSNHLIQKTDQIIESTRRMEDVLPEGMSQPERDMVMALKAVQGQIRQEHEADKKLIESIYNIFAQNLERLQQELSNRQQ